MKQILIIGLGLIGGSIAKSLQNINQKYEINAFDIDDSVIQNALKEKIIDKSFDIKDNSKDFDLIIISTPPLSTIKIIEQLINNTSINLNTTITEVSSSKVMLYRDLSKKGIDCSNIVLSHPMAGSEKSGIKASSANLFLDKKTIILNPFNSDKFHVTKVNNFWKTIGSQIYEMNINEHEKAMAYASHLPHLISFGLINAIREEENDNIAKFAAGGLKEFLRIGGSNPKMWTDIFFSNNENLIDALSLFNKNTEEILSLSNNKVKLESLLEKIKKYKQKKF
jgi:prephenate dehydrogenase